MANSKKATMAKHIDDSFQRRNRERKIPVQVYLNENEFYLLEQKVKLSGCASRSAVIRQLILHGYVYDVDYSELRGVHEALSRINTNLNQIAKLENNPGLKAWQQRQNLKIAAHAFSATESIEELKGELATHRHTARELQSTIVAMDKEMVIWFFPMF